MEDAEELVVILKELYASLLTLGQEQSRVRQAILSIAESRSIDPGLIRELEIDEGSTQSRLAAETRHNVGVAVGSLSPTVSDVVARYVGDAMASRFVGFVPSAETMTRVTDIISDALRQEYGRQGNQILGKDFWLIHPRAESGFVAVMITPRALHGLDIVLVEEGPGRWKASDTARGVFVVGSRDDEAMIALALTLGHCTRVEA